MSCELSNLNNTNEYKNFLESVKEFIDALADSIRENVEKLYGMKPSKTEVLDILLKDLKKDLKELIKSNPEIVHASGLIRKLGSEVLDLMLLDEKSIEMLGIIIQTASGIVSEKKRSQAGVVG